MAKRKTSDTAARTAGSTLRQVREAKRDSVTGKTVQRLSRDGAWSRAADIARKYAG
jgi:hypothetical protein